MIKVGVLLNCYLKFMFLKIIWILRKKECLIY